MEPGAGPTECSGPRPRTADSSQASFPTAHDSKSPFWFCHFRKHSFLPGRRALSCPPPPSRHAPAPRKGQGGSSQPPLPGRPTLPHQQPDTCQEAGRGGALVGRTGGTVCVGGCQAARALPQRHGERAWLCEVSAVAKAGAAVLFGATCVAFWGADGHAPCSRPPPAGCTPLRSTSFHVVHLPGKEHPVAPPQRTYSSCRPTEQAQGYTCAECSTGAPP